MNPDETSRQPAPPSLPMEGPELWSQFGQPPVSSPRLWLHLALLLATVATTIVAGALQHGVDPFTHPGDLYQGGFAISIVDEEEARQVFAYLKEMDELEELKDQ